MAASLMSEPARSSSKDRENVPCLHSLPPSLPFLAALSGAAWLAAARSRQRSEREASCIRRQGAAQRSSEDAFKMEGRGAGGAMHFKWPGRF